MAMGIGRQRYRRWAPSQFALRPAEPEPEPQPVRVEMTGQLIGAQGLHAIEVLHLRIDPGQGLEQEQLAQLAGAGARVRVTVELVPADVAEGGSK